MKQIKIGALVNTHGLKGEVKVKPLTDFPDIRFAKGNTINVQYKDTLIPVKIKNVRDQKGMLLICFEGYNDINQVEAWKGSALSVKEEQLHELEEDEAYFFELMNCEVVDEQKHLLGIVSEVIETGANAVLRVNGDREYLIPYVKAFVTDFDRENKKISVKLVEGL